MKWSGRVAGCVVGCVVLGMASGALGAPEDQDTFTDFSEFTPNTVFGVPFDVGVTPDRATFGGDAFAGVAGIGELYFSGVRAWMVGNTGVGTIDFETPAATVEFWARTRSIADDVTIITAFDPADVVVASETLVVGDAFRLISFTGAIGSIRVENFSIASDTMMSIDNFGYTSVPAPAGAALLGLGGLAMTRRRR